MTTTFSSFVSLSYYILPSRENDTSDYRSGVHDLLIAAAGRQRCGLPPGAESRLRFLTAAIMTRAGQKWPNPHCWTTTTGS